MREQSGVNRSGDVSKTTRDLGESRAGGLDNFPGMVSLSLERPYWCWSHRRAPEFERCPWVCATSMLSMRSMDLRISHNPPWGDMGVLGWAMNLQRSRVRIKTQWRRNPLRPEARQMNTWEWTVCLGMGPELPVLMWTLDVSTVPMWIWPVPTTSSYCPENTEKVLTHRYHPSGEQGGGVETPKG